MRTRLTLLATILAALPATAFAAGAEAPSAAPTAELLAQQSESSLSDTVEETAEETAEEAPRAPFDLPVDLSASVSTSFSLGSISRNNFGTRDSVSSAWGFGVSGNITDRLSASLGAGFTACLNKNCGIVRPGEVRFNDMSAGLSLARFYEIPVIGVGISAGLGATIPTSRVSRVQNLYTTLSPSVSLGRSFGPFSLNYGFGFSKNFNQFRVVAQSNEGQFERAVNIRDGGAERAGANFVEQSGYLGEWSTSHSLSAGLALKNVSLSLGWSFADVWTYRTDLNAPSSLDGVTIRDPGGDSRRGHSQFMTGSIGMSYALPVWENRIGLSARLATSQPPKTADNRRVRFPFWDTQSANLSYTSLGFTLSVRY